MASAALSAYRHLLRASRLTFSGDSQTLEAAYDRIRNEFRTAKSETDANKIQELIRSAHDNANFLLSQVIQAPLDADTRSYRVVLNAKHSQVIGHEGKLEAPASRGKHQPTEPESGCCGGCHEFKN